MEKAYQRDTLSAFREEIFDDPRQREIGFDEENSAVEFKRRSIYKIISVKAFSPAESAGLTINDTIISVDGESFYEAGVGVLLEKLSKSKGESVTFRVVENQVSSKPVSFDSLKYREVVVQPVWSDELKRWSIGFGFMSVHVIDSDDERFKERARFSFDHINFNGTKICPVEIVLSPERQTTGENKDTSKRRRIEKYTLMVAQEDGSMKEYDILERFNKSKATVFWDPDMESAGVYNFRENTVEIKDPFSKSVVHTLIHEFRHSTQERYDILIKNYQNSLGENYENNDFWTKTIQSRQGYDKFRSIISRVLGRMNNNILRDFDTRYGDLYSELKFLEITLLRSLPFQGNIKVSGDTQEISLQKYLEVKKQIDDLKDKLPNAETIVCGTIRVVDILKLPTCLIERDAEYGALMGLRAIKKETGIDFLAKISRETGEQIEEALGKVIEGPVTVKTLVEYIESVYTTQAYLDKIGVPRGCVQKLKKEEKRLSKRKEF